MNYSQAKTNGKATETGQIMHWFVENYYTDMLPYIDLSLIEIYDIIKNLPYRPDPANEETLMRPMYTMQGLGWGGDCDCKSIALAGYAKLHGIPYRFVAVRSPGKKLLHHVFPQLYLYGEWIDADPTYKFNTFGRSREKYDEYRII